MARFAFLREAQIWYNRGSTGELAAQHFENVIVLSEEFYAVLDCRRNPAWTRKRLKNPNVKA
jgi:hypothetical protein